MKHNLTLLTLVAMSGLLVGCAKKDAPTAEEHKSAEPEKRVKHGANGEVIITLDAETQKRLGLESVALTAAQFAPEIKAVGRVLDPVGISGLVGDFISAGAAAGASAKELERAKTLVMSDNISARALQTAEAAAARDVVQVEVARAKLIGSLGKDLGGRANLPDLVKALVAGNSALVRLELLPGDSLPNPMTVARLFSLGESTNTVEGKFVGATTLDPQTQTRGLLFLVELNSSGLAVGEAVTGFIKISGEAQAGVVVPRNTVVRFNGAPWVYVQTNDQEFARREISTERPGDGGWFVTRGLAAGDKVVTAGAQIILSTEMSAAGFSDGEHH